MQIRTILVEPKIEENIGAVARVLKTCEIVGSIKEAIENSAIVAGTTSKHGISPNKHLRMPFFSPQQLKETVKGIGADKSAVLSILFGREDIGLKREELMLCDIVVCVHIFFISSFSIFV